MTTLPDDIYAQIVSNCAHGDELAKTGRYGEALRLYWAAWDLLPELQTQWEAATWILGTVGDINFRGGDYVAGRDNLSYAMSCPGAIGNPLLHLRLGQCQFELQSHDRAVDELIRAYMGAGPEIFQKEDPKYIRFLQTRALDIQAPHNTG